MAPSEPPSPVSPPASLHSQHGNWITQPAALVSPTASNPIPTPARTDGQGSRTTAQSPPPPSSTVNGDSAHPSMSPMRGRRRSSGRPKNLFQRLHSAFSPSTHDLKEHHFLPPDTVRPYLHRQQRNRLQRKSWTEWLITLVLCIAYFLILYLYQRDKAIDKMHRRIINSLVTGVVLLLGINLNNSLRSYAKMLRWRFVASGYRSLKEFDLLMGCDSIMNVVSLLRHGRHKDRKFPFNSKVQVYALLWLIVQLGIVLCIGVIGLTYNLEISQTFVNTRVGNTSSIELLSLSTGNYLSDLARVNQWGVRGVALQPARFNTLDKDYASFGSYLANGQGHSRRYFVDYNPDHFDISVVSNRYIDSLVVCTQYRVTDGAYGNQTYFTYDIDGEARNETFLNGSPGPSGLYVTASTNSTCGLRCTNVILFQAQSLDEDLYGTSGIYIDHALRFECNNTVPDVEDLKGPIDPIYSIPEFLSRMLAGILAWSPIPPNGTRESQLYQEASSIGWYAVPTEVEVADYVSRWTVAAVAAMDARDGSTTQSGIQRMFVSNGYQPIQAQILDVKWWAAGAILGAIPFVHFWTLIIVLFFANKVIIKDDNPIAVAKVYHTLLHKIGPDHGCMLTGDQLIEALEDDHGVSNVIFGTKDGIDNVRHVDIFEEGSGVKAERVFPEGDYDGAGDGSSQKRWKRNFDAREYF